MKQDNSENTIEEETGHENHVKVVMPKVPPDKLSGLPRIHESDGLFGGLERGAGATPELEALEFAARFENEFEVAPEDVRPCVSTIYYQGVASQRELYAFILASEFNYLGVSEDGTQEALQNFNSRLSRRLLYSEIAKFGRKFDSGRYDNRYDCKREELLFYCIGEDCPWRAQREGTAKKEPILSTFFSLGWPAYLKDPYAVVLYFGLQDLRQLKGLPPNKEMRFKYPRIIELTGLSKSIITNRIKKLSEVGLIEELTIGNKWGTGRKRTCVKLATPMPEPKFWHKSG